MWTVDNMPCYLEYFTTSDSMRCGGPEQRPDARGQGHG